MDLSKTPLCNMDAGFDALTSAKDALISKLKSGGSSALSGLSSLGSSLKDKLSGLAPSLPDSFRTELAALTSKLSDPEAVAAFKAKWGAAVSGLSETISNLGEGMSPCSAPNVEMKNGVVTQKPEPGPAPTGTPASSLPLVSTVVDNSESRREIQANYTSEVIEPISNLYAILSESQHSLVIELNELENGDVLTEVRRKTDGVNYKEYYRSGGFHPEEKVSLERYLTITETISFIVLMYNLCLDYEKAYGAYTLGKIPSEPIKSYGSLQSSTGIFESSAFCSIPGPSEITFDLGEALDEIKSVYSSNVDLIKQYHNK